MFIILHSGAQTAIAVLYFFLNECLVTATKSWKITKVKNLSNKLMVLLAVIMWTRWLPVMSHSVRNSCLVVPSKFSLSPYMSSDF